MGDGLDIPTCILKVNIQCCAACPMKAKKKLQKIKGVYAVHIDIKNGMVSVQGIVQPSILIQILSQKVGKKVELYAYEKNLMIQNETLDLGICCSACKYEEKNQTCSFTDEANDQDKGEGNRDQAVHNEVKGSIPEGPEGSLSWHHPQSGMKKKKRGFADWFGKKSNFERRVFGNFRGLRPGYAKLPRTPPPLPSYGDGQYPPASNRIKKPRWPYLYGFNEKKEPPIGNSPFHSFRDDNVNACSIM